MADISKLKDHFQESKIYFNRTMAALIIILIAFTIIIARAVFLQVIKHDLYFTLATNNQVRIIPIPPPRGLIFDRNGELIAENVPSCNLTIIASRQKNLKQTIAAINKIIPITEQEQQLFFKQKKYKSDYEQIPIKTKLTEAEVAKFSVEKFKFDGVDIQANLARNYKFPKPTSHVIGYIGPISDVELKHLDTSKYRSIYQIGKTGIEQYYEDMLRGEIGYKHVETNSRGMILRTLAEKPAIPGKNIYLSLDIQLQKLAYTLMEGKRGAFVAIEPKTGEVLALVSTPGFDANLFVQGISNTDYQALNASPEKPLFNRAIRGQYPPGSTVKPIIALKALDDEIISSSDHVYDPGYYQLNSEGRVFRDWDHHGHGKVNVEKAIFASCSTFFYYIAHKLGIDKIHSIFTTFNLGNRTDIDLQGEACGIAPSVAWKEHMHRKPWFPGETLNVGIGQGYTLATPIQIATMAVAIANRGVLMQPKLVKYLQDIAIPDNKTFVTHKLMEIPLKNPKNWDIIINSMQKTVTSPMGTGYRTFIGYNHLSVAGKTGTSQVFGLKENQNYNKDELAAHLLDHSWFMGFSPIKDPKIAVAAILENENGAAKICRDIIEYYLMQNKLMEE